MYTIKQIPEDFIVNEISSVKGIAAKKSEEPGSAGKYGYYILKKVNYTTSKALERIAEKLGIKQKQIGFAGTKDKRAVTEQFISIRNCNVKALDLKDISIKLVAKGNEPISLGDLKGNDFIITVRNLDEKDVPKIPKSLEILNIFDEQRFSRNNVEIGKAIIKNDFKGAVELILENESVFKGEYEANVRAYLAEKPADFIGALRNIPRKIAMMFVHSFQSDVWNMMTFAVKEMIAKKKIKPGKNYALPIIGFGTEFKDSSIKKIAEDILKKEGIIQRDFIIRQFHELSSEGTERKMFVKVKNIKIIGRGDDEINNGKKKVTVGFSLPKASYATAVIKELFKEVA